MDWASAVSLLVAQTGHERYRQLCAESHPDHLTWRRHVVARAMGTHVDPHPPTPTHGRPQVTVAEAWDLTRAMKACPFWSRRPGCCTGANCALRRGAIVTHIACFECIKTHG